MPDLLRAGVGAGALLAGIGVLYNYVVVVPHEHATQQRITHGERIVLISPKTGNRLVLNGDGFRFLDKQGHPLAKLTQSDGNPELTLTQWRETWTAEQEVSAVFSNRSKKRSQPPKLKEVGFLDLRPTQVFMGACPMCAENSATLGLEGGPFLALNSGGWSAMINNSGLSEFIHCSKEVLHAVNAKSTSTCYASHISLGEFPGLLSLKTCKTEGGAPLSKAHKEEGCESVHIGSGPWGLVAKGPRIVLREDGKPRLAIGSARLKWPSVGGHEITPISQITAFNKKGTVVWSIPGP